ncbi:MAG: hypothetical protein LBB58_06750, partial [Cellulomonadaceae bacterium]|nr:hypothetical protein [Cellulomonadaceae bacterium]
MTYIFLPLGSTKALYPHLDPALTRWPIILASGPLAILRKCAGCANVATAWASGEHSGFDLTANQL